MFLEDGLEYGFKRRYRFFFVVDNGEFKILRLLIFIFNYVNDNDVNGEILSFFERRVMDWYFVYLEYGCVVLLKDVFFFYWN